MNCLNTSTALPTQYLPRTERIWQNVPSSIFANIFKGNRKQPFKESPAASVDHFQVEGGWAVAASF